MMIKSKFLTIFLPLFALFVFNSCSEETELIDPCVLNPCNGSSFQVDFNAQTYTATTTQAAFTADGIVISGARSNGQNFELLIDGTTTGTYSADKVLISYVENIAAEFDYVNEDSAMVTNGTITISEINSTTNLITGTFSFTGHYSDYDDTTRKPIVFTNGKFTIPYTGVNPNPNPNPTTSFFKADFSGQTFNATTTQALIAGGSILLQGAKANGENFSFIIEGTTAKTYSADDVLLTYTPNATSEFGYWNMNETLESNGSVVITEINTTNKTISGTFQYTGHWSDSDDPKSPIVFTNGSFTVAYTESNTSSDTFFAKVDGVEFEDDLIAVAVASGGTAADEIITVNAIDADQNKIVVSFREDFTVGQTYSISNAPQSLFRAEYTLDDTEYPATAGTIKITSKTDIRVAGTFQITVLDSVSNTGFTITEGAFDVEF